MDIYTPSVPKHLVITQTMIEDFLIDPVLGAEILMGEKLDEFQKTRLRVCWWVPRVMDSSGFSSAKTKNMWLVGNLRLLLMSDRIGLAAYPVFATGQNSYWKYYNEVAGRSRIFRVNLGRRRLIGVDGKTDDDGKATLKGQSCWTCDYRNGSKMMMPAVGFLTEARQMASLRINDLYVDEHTKAEATGSRGIDQQLIGRCTYRNYNKNHPLYTNHHLFCATAEDILHPSYARYRSFKEEVDRGNPDYALLNFSYKDYSEREFVPGKSFKDVFREDKIIRDMRKNKTRSSFLQEVFGIWSKNGVGWYTDEIIDLCYRLGKERNVVTISGHADDWEPDKLKRSKINYFLGADIAKSDQKVSDDGALSVLRAIPIVDKPSRELRNWQLDYVWGWKVRGADVDQWSGIIHKKHRQFNFSGIVMDPNGGGQWIYPKLAKSSQTILGKETKVRPIARLEDEANMVTADFILSMFAVGDRRIEKMWEHLGARWDDKLYDIAHCELRDAMALGAVGCSPKFMSLIHQDVPGWNEERATAAKMVELGMTQLRKIVIAVNEDGTTHFTNHGARQFSSKQRKDFAYAMLYAFVAFLEWVQQFDVDENEGRSDEDSSLCD